MNWHDWAFIVIASILVAGGIILGIAIGIYWWPPC